MGSSPTYHSFYERIPDEHTTAFKVDSSAKIPEVSSFRSPEQRRERMDSLMSLPNHKPAATKFNPDLMVRTMIPLTQEDKE